MDPCFDVMCITSIWNILQCHNNDQMVMAIITVAFIGVISMMYLHQSVLIWLCTLMCLTYHNRAKLIFNVFSQVCAEQCERAVSQCINKNADWANTHLGIVILVFIFLECPSSDTLSQWIISIGGVWTFVCCTINRSSQLLQNLKIKCI